MLRSRGCLLQIGRPIFASYFFRFEAKRNGTETVSLPYVTCCLNFILCSVPYVATVQYSTVQYYLIPTSFCSYSTVLYNIILFSFCCYCTVQCTASSSISYDATVQNCLLFLTLLQSHPLFLMLLQPHPLLLSVAITSSSTSFIFTTSSSIPFVEDEVVAT